MNIVLIVIDTLRYDYVGAHGNDWIQTPNLDRLAAESWVFDNAYAASYPTIPHRTDVITGRYGGPFHTWQPLPFDFPTLPRALSNLGYCTQLIHDTPHLVNGGHHFDYPFHAWRSVRGAEVDRSWIMDHLPWPENWGIDPAFDEVAPRPERDQPVDGDSWFPAYLAAYIWANRGRHDPADWNCARLFGAAAEFLADNRRRDNFFLWLDCFDPHEPWEAPPEFMRKYDKTGDGCTDPRSLASRGDNLPDACAAKLRAAYAAKVSWMDHCLGEFLDALDRTDLGDRTAVILTSDHGTNDGTVPGRGFGKKGPPIEAEAHVPMFVRVPDGGRGRCDALVQPQDLFATVMRLAGGRAPLTIESQDLLALAQGKREPARRIALCGSGAESWARPGEHTLFSVYDGDWCLQMAAATETTRLCAMGSLADQSAERTDDVARLRALAIDEIERRGAAAELVHWLRRDGRGAPPGWTRWHDGHPKPSGYVQYFMRLYRD